MKTEMTLLDRIRALLRGNNYLKTVFPFTTYHVKRRSDDGSYLVSEGKLREIIVDDGQLVIGRAEKCRSHDTWEITGHLSYDLSRVKVFTAGLTPFIDRRINVNKLKPYIGELPAPVYEEN